MSRFKVIIHRFNGRGVKVNVCTFNSKFLRDLFVQAYRRTVKDIDYTILLYEKGVIKQTIEKKASVV